MANFDLSYPNQLLRPGWNPVEAHRLFHQGIINMKAELEKVTPPATVSTEQVNALTGAWREAKNDFFQARADKDTADALARRVFALCEGAGTGIPEDRQSAHAVWVEQTKRMTSLGCGILRIFKDVRHHSRKAQLIHDRVAMRSFKGEVDRVEMEQALRELWGEVVKQMVSEFFRYQ